MKKLLLAVMFCCNAYAAQDPDLPNKKLTPGVVDQTVTQSNIQHTICVSGYTRTVRPSAGYTNKLKKQQIIQYGYLDKDPTHYEEDHLISLELGGHPIDPKNLWPQPWNGCGAKRKDKIENLLHNKVCSEQITLKEAQRSISTNWKKAYQQYIGMDPCK